MSIFEYTHIGGERVENLFKTLGDQNRLRIINLLRKEELCVCEIEAILDTTQSNVSRHLARLRSEEMVVFERRSQWTYYQINPEFIEKNELLYKFISENMDKNSELVADLEILSKYKESGMDCENIEDLFK